MTEMISKWFFASFRTLPFVFLYGDQEPRSWGGGGAFKRPPPAGGGKSRGPAGRGLICRVRYLVMKSLWVFLLSHASNGGGAKRHVCPAHLSVGGGQLVLPCSPPPPPRFRRHWLSQSICLTWADFTPSVQCAVPVYLFWPEPISPLWYSVLSHSISLTWADFTPSVQCAVPVHLFDLSRFHPSGTVCCPSPSVWPEPISPLRYSVLSHSISLTWSDFTPSVQCAVPVHLFDLSRFHPSGTVCCPIPSLWAEPISPLRYSVLSRSICFDLSWLHSSVQCAVPVIHSLWTGMTHQAKQMDWDGIGTVPEGWIQLRSNGWTEMAHQVKQMDWGGTLLYQRGSQIRSNRWAGIWLL